MRLERIAVLRHERHERVGRRIENRALRKLACALAEKLRQLGSGMRMRRYRM